ncbi:MAG: nucleotide sugar dehydrogenase, partial [Clostridia bacterium]|nr:nucleotide sugar dehydrogenase [Clostridia bacterium]
MDVYEIIKICNMHPRVNILNPGPGVGGHCIPVDPWFLVGDYPELAKVIGEALEVNESMPAFVLEKAKEIMRKEGKADLSKIGLYGIAYKENVDDYRESPTLQMLEYCKEKYNLSLKSYDPYIKKDVCENQYHDFDEFLKDTDFVIIMVGHDEIKTESAWEKLRNKTVLDTRRAIKKDGVYYI